MGENTLNTNQLLFLQIEEGGGDICQGRLIIAWMIGLYQRINKEEKLVSNKAKKAILYLILYFWEKVKNGWMIWIFYYRCKHENNVFTLVLGFSFLMSPALKKVSAMYGWSDLLIWPNWQINTSDSLTFYKLCQLIWKNLYWRQSTAYA